MYAFLTCENKKMMLQSTCTLIGRLKQHLFTHLMKELHDRSDNLTNPTHWHTKGQGNELAQLVHVPLCQSCPDVLQLTSQQLQHQSQLLKAKSYIKLIWAHVKPLAPHQGLTKLRKNLLLLAICLYLADCSLIRLL